VRFTYRVELAYDGAAFAAFAVVPGQRTVWSAVRDALVPIVPDLSRLAAAGRTDKGVSAIGQVFSFVARQPIDCAVIARALELDGLAPIEVRKVSSSFHAQFSAVARRYAYFHEDDGTTDVARIDRMLCAIQGRHDFNAFARETPPGKETIKILSEARARRVTPTLVRFDFAGQAFLRRQVRVLVSTALREAALGADDDALLRLLIGRDRPATPHPAPAAGLYLVRVGYDPIRFKGS
jgi:tRNA pseudouridine38-40 synthase